MADPHRGVAHELPGPGWLVPVGITILGALLAALIVRMVPLASGSGIQHVEAVDRGQAEPPPLSVLPSRFVGALLSIGSGLVLGREGPIVHMGAAVGAEAARRARHPEHERLLQTSVSGAGLAVAFNAPIGGALFVFEEVTGSFRVRTVVPVVESVRSLSPVTKAAIIGGLVGLLSVVAPWAGGGGDSLVQHVVGGGALALPVVAWYVLLRFVAGPLSYAAGTPGGLFAPLLALGALWGLLCAGICAAIVPGLGSSLAVPMAIAGMAALFGASVRAPITGVVLVVEMTAATGVTVPMLAAAICAVVVAYSTRVPPIYDSLRDRMFGAPPARG